MQLFKQKKSKKTSNQKLKLGKKRFFSKKRFLPVAAIFGVVGAYFVYQSFAYTPMLPGNKGEYNAVTPTRIMDTRTGNGGYSVAIPANGTYSLQVTGRGGIPEVAAVDSVVLSIYAVTPASAGFLTTWPSGSARPPVSNINYAIGETVGNQVTVPVGADGKIQLYSSSSSHVIVDVTGYFSKENGASGSRFNALTPSRILDTRNGNGGFTLPLATNGTYTVQVTGRGGVPSSNVRAVVINLTATGATANGTAIVYPAGAPKLSVSSTSYVKGKTVAKLITVPVSVDGKVTLFNSGSTTHFIFDVAGYYDDALAPADSNVQAGRFIPLNPSRIMDTRNGNGGYSVAIPANGTYTLQVNGRGGVPTGNNVRAVVVNLTAVAPTAGGFLTAWPTGSTRPTASNVNFMTGQTIANQAIVKVGADGKIQLTSPVATHIIVDVAGYYLEFEDQYLGTSFQAVLRNNTDFISGPYIDRSLSMDINVSALQTKTDIDFAVDSIFDTYGGYRMHYGRVTIKDGLDEIWFRCSELATRKCKLLATNGIQKNSTDNTSTTITIPYDMLNGSHRISYDLNIDQPNYPGKWLTVSISSPQGIKTALYTEAIESNRVIFEWPKLHYFREGYSCENTTITSISLGNIVSDGSTDFTLDPWQGTSSTTCAGYAKTVFIPGASSQPTLYKAEFGVPKASRDITPPIMSEVTYDIATSKINFTATDDGFIESFGQAIGASGGSVSHVYTKDFSFPYVTPLSTGTHTIRVWVNDNSGNKTEKTISVTIP